MSNQPTSIPPRFLVTKEAARFVGLSPRTMEKHRSYGTGPAYYKLGGRIVYAIDDLQAWAHKGRRRSTSEMTSDTVLPAKRRLDGPYRQVRESLDAS